MKRFRRESSDDGKPAAVPPAHAGLALESGTFSRYVLPFRYQLEEWSRCDGATYERDNVSSQADGDRTFERLHYLTAETAEVLFGRAVWLRLKASPTPHIIFLRGRQLTIEIGPPRIVLFEHGRNGFNSLPRADILQTGFLLVDVRFPEQQFRPELDDLLLLNELFRYCRIPFSDHPAFSGYAQSLGSFRKGTGNAQYRQWWEHWLKRPWHIDDRRLRLFPSEWEQDAEGVRAAPLGGIHADARGWMTYADNRTFVWTCARVKGGTRALQSIMGGTKRAMGQGHWIKLLNVDRPGSDLSASASASEFERRWAKERTYTRWEEEGSVYGFTTHSGAALIDSDAPPHITANFEDMYFDQTLLLLYLRVTTFRFSESLSRVSAQSRDLAVGAQKDRRIAEEKLRQEFESLRRDFALFTNLYQFPLVSNQQQGIEMYAYARKGMDVDELFREIQQEIASTHEYFELADTQRQTRTMTVLSVVGGAGFALVLATSFFGMNIIVPDFGYGHEFCGLSDWRCHLRWLRDNLIYFMAILSASTVLVCLGTQWTRRYLGYGDLPQRCRTLLSDFWKYGIRRRPRQDS
jgi:hypothetical protein